MSKKFLTKLLNKDYRQRVISSISPKRLAELKIPQYARYQVDKTIISRDKSHENDREWAYGFSPLEVLAYVGKDGTLVTKLFEFNTVNHFLREKDGDSAAEVVTAILVDWAKSNPDVRDFDIDEIDAGLKKIEDEYAEEERKREEAEKRASDAALAVKNAVEPVANSISGRPYDDALAEIEAKLKPALDSLVSDGKISEYELGYSRNTAESKSAGMFLLDVRYRSLPGSEVLVLKCDVRPPSKEN